MCDRRVKLEVISFPDVGVIRASRVLKMVKETDEHVWFIAFSLDLHRFLWKEFSFVFVCFVNEAERKRAAVSGSMGGLCNT